MQHMNADNSIEQMGALLHQVTSMQHQEQSRIMHALGNMLPQIHILVQKNDKIVRLRQEHFNIFSILRKEHDEERLHSRFIAELLNPQGSHYMGAVFCALFISRVVLPCQKIAKESNTNNTAVHTARNIANEQADVVSPWQKIIEDGNADNITVRTEHSTGNGRVDISLQYGDLHIFIENKIYAGDQPTQLVRYRTCLDDMGQGSRNILLYLTLYGHDPHSTSTEDGDTRLIKGKNYYVISYKEHIFNWLTLCLKEAASHPTVRETIRQYITLIKKLTYQLEDEMKEGMKKLLKVADNYEAYLVLSTEGKKIVQEESNNFVRDIAGHVLQTLQEQNAKWKWEKDRVTRGGDAYPLVYCTDWHNEIRLEIGADRYGIWCNKHMSMKEQNIRNMLDKNAAKMLNILDVSYDDWQPFNKRTFKEEKEKYILFHPDKRKKRAEEIIGNLIELGKICQDAFIKK